MWISGSGAGDGNLDFWIFGFLVLDFWFWILRNSILALSSWVLEMEIWIFGLLEIWFWI